MKDAAAVGSGSARRRRSIGASVLVLLAVALGALVSGFDWNWLKGPIESRVTEATGRRFSIDGRLRGEWRLQPLVRMERVRFANPEWAEAPELLTAEAAEIRVALLPLLTKRVHILELVLFRPAVALERSADGRATWLFDREQRDAGAGLHIDALRVDDGVVRYRDAQTNSRLTALVRDDSDAKDAGLSFSAKGILLGQTLDVTGRTVSLLALRDTSRPLPVRLEGTVAGTRIRIDGEVDGLTVFERATLRYDVRGPSLARLAPLFRVPLPETPRYAVSGLLTRDGRLWRSRDLKGTVGASDIAGDVSVTTGGARPVLEARLQSRLLDLADLGPLIGGDARAEAREAKNSSRVFASRRLDLSRIDQLDARVTLTAGRVVRAADFPFDNFAADFRLQDARIVIDPLAFGMADGTLRGRITLDGRRAPVEVSARAHLDNVRVAKIFPKQGAIGEAAGTLSGRVDIAGRGNSVAAVFATGNGRASLLLSNGRVASLLPALADLDGARVIASFLGKHPEIVQCTAIDLQASGGIVTPEVAIVETESTVLDLNGELDLRDETLALKVTQAPKHVSFFSVRTPLLVTGTLRNPRLSLEPVPLVTRTAGAVVLGMINPPAALLALVETGPGEDGTCTTAPRRPSAKNPAKDAS